MPKLSATDGIASGEQIKRVELSAADVTTATDEELAVTLARIRRGRETYGGPKKASAGGATKAPRVAATPVDENAEQDLEDSE